MKLVAYMIAFQLLVTMTLVALAVTGSHDMLEQIRAALL
jgi:heme/copper-type cytochrome/quinol oxidase subunit 4